MVVLRNKRKLVLQQVQDKARELEKQLELKLGSRKQALEAELVTLTDRISELEAEEKRLLDEVSIQETTKQGLEQEIASLQDHIKHLTTEETGLKEQIIRDRATVSSLEGQKGTLEHEISSLEETLIDKKRLVAAVDDEIIALEARKTNVVVELQNAKDQKTKQLLDLDAQLMKKLAMLKEISQKDKSMRESIVTRVRELDLREDNIKRRELIVGTAEEKIRNNADMLKL